MTEKFQTVVSKVNKPITYLLTGILWLVIIIILIVMGVISENIYSHFRRYIEDDPGTFFHPYFCPTFITILRYSSNDVFNLSKKKKRFGKLLLMKKELLFITGRTM